MSIEPRFKTNQADCGCGDSGCLAFGTLKRPWRDGTVCARGCQCKRCKGSAIRRDGVRKQAHATSKIGIKRSSLYPGNEETLAGALRVEVKSGAEAAKVLTAYLNAKAQSDASRAIGDHRPFLAMFTDGRRVLAVMDSNDIADVLADVDGAA